MPETDQNSPWRSFEKPPEKTLEKNLEKFPQEISFTVLATPMGAPRQTQRDRFAQRPCVVRYREFKDAIRDAAPELPPVERILSLSWIAYFEPRDARLLGGWHRAKPDRDNVDKAILDALFKEDSGVSSGWIAKKWGTPPRVEIKIKLVEPQVSDDGQSVRKAIVRPNEIEPADV